jgi:hypothetical protein
VTPEKLAHRVDNAAPRTTSANIIISPERRPAIGAEVMQAVGEERKVGITSPELLDIHPVHDLHLEHGEMILLFTRGERPLPALRQRQGLQMRRNPGRVARELVTQRMNER